MDKCAWGVGWAYFRIIVMVAFLFSPWKGNDPVNISYYKKVRGEKVKYYRYYLIFTPLLRVGGGQWNTREREDRVQS